MPDSLATRLQRMRQYFDSGITKPYSFRKDQLKRLKKAILDHEKDLHEALFTDLKKSPEESWVTETGMVITELNAALKNLRGWMRPEHTSTNLLNLPSSSKIMKEPLGVVLIIGPWNYPFQLLFNPLVGAIAAGNCVVLKPSEFAPATDAVMEKIIGETFSDEYILYVRGEGTSVIPEMMSSFTFDHVFYTGSTPVGKLIYKMAAEKLVPVTLELGGKSPCVVEKDANLKVSARRIALTKFSNAGQMCVAPDYVMVHTDVKEKFLELIKGSVQQFFGNKPEESYNYGRMVNERQFNRVVNYIQQGTVVYGGRHDKTNLFIEPTILENVPVDSPMMQDEIFGPVLPVIAFKTKEEALAVINRNKNPLAFYVFTGSKNKEDYWLDS